MRLNPFRRRTASDHARALGAKGLAAQSDAEREKAKRDAMTRELARCAGMPLPKILRGPAEG